MKKLMLLALLGVGGVAFGMESGQQPETKEKRLYFWWHQIKIFGNELYIKPGLYPLSNFEEENKKKGEPYKENGMWKNRILAHQKAAEAGTFPYCCTGYCADDNDPSHSITIFVREGTAEEHAQLEAQSKEQTSPVWDAIEKEKPQTEEQFKALIERVQRATEQLKEAGNRATSDNS